ncbi:hypothetical protein ABPG72_018779 [Tetrahymena utriculariae]
MSIMIKRLLLLIIAYIQLFILEAGIVNPDKADPIVLERTNEGAISSYTFYINLQNRLPPQKGVVKITFPTSTFADPLENTSLQLSDADFPFVTTNNHQVTIIQNDIFLTQDGTLAKNYFTAAWNMIERSLKISGISESINAGSLQITIKFLRNPSISANQVSGNFKIETFIETTPLDQNLSFGKVTFTSRYIKSNQISISNDGSNLGGYLTNYKFTISTVVTLPSQSWIRVRFPKYHSFENTICQIVETQEFLNCSNNGDNVLIFSPISQSLSPSFYNMQIRNIRNPTSSDFYSDFIVELLFPGTFNVLQLFYNQLSGINIQPGQVQSTSVSGNPLNMNLRIDYTITFTPTNTIQSPGTIVITFPTLPPTQQDPQVRTFTLDSLCRVISGLTPTPGNENVSCVNLGSQLIITNFQTFFSQQIQVKIFAVNPGRPAIYSPFVIETFTTQNGKKYKIDQNTNAGSLAISEINSLNYVQIDFFKKMVNGTFSQTIPLDFRLYPAPGNELPLTTASQTGQISLQIPLLWRNKAATYNQNYQVGQNSAAKFGIDPSQTVPVSYDLNVYKIFTPKSSDDAKYPKDQQYGLGQCDLPISIDSVILPPFGGKYLFRVLTFKNGQHYVDQPIEQDLYVMDIEIPPFTSANIQTTGSESGDTENIIIVQLTTGLTIPYEGAINFNMTTKTIYSENTSKWDFKLGQSIGVGVESTNVPCSVYIAGNLCGFPDSDHPDVHCYVFQGSAIQNVILQVRGFSRVIVPSTAIQIYVPNIRLCEDVTKVCYVQINSSYTVDILDPYILNTIYVKVVNSVNDPSIVSRTPVIQAKPVFGNSLPENQEICVSTLWDLGSTFYDNPFKSGDSIVIIFPSYRYTYRRNAVQQITFNFGSASGNVQYIDYYLTKETYYLITLNSNVPLGSNLILKNIKNANDIIDYGDGNKVQGVVLKGFYWQSQLKTRFLQWNRSDQYVDGGILNTKVEILPNETPGVPVRNQSTDMEWESEIVYTLSFINCRIIPAGGKIMIKLPNNSPGYKSVSDTCTIFQGLTGISQLSLDSSIVCAKQVIGPDIYLSVSQFMQVPQETLITVIYRSTSPVFQGPSWNPGNYYITSNQNDAPTYTMINFSRVLIPGLVINGPNIFPTLTIWSSFYIQDRLAREGERGYFKMYFESPLPFAKGSTMTVDLGGGVSQPFTIEKVYDVDDLVMQGYLYCTIDGDICEDCTISGDIITLLLPKSLKLDGIIANKQYLLSIGYRGNDDSSTTRDGFQINQAGTYILSVDISDGANKVSAQKAYRNLPPSFRNFWVYSVNKMNTDTTDIKCFNGGTNICGMSVFIFYFNHYGIPKSYIAGSSSTKIILEFSTQIDSIFQNGFDSALGKGLPQRTEVPCEGKKISILSGFDKLSCQLYLGTKPNPAQIIITNFDDIISNLDPKFTDDYEIHIPNIFNPYAVKEVIQVNMRVETTYFSNGVTRPIYENSYILVNMTNQILSVPFHQKPVFVDLTSSCSPYFSQTIIDTPSKLYVCFQTGPHKLQPGDHILYQFPQTWIMPRIDLCSLFSFPSGVKCDSYDSAKQILIHINGAVSPGTMISGYINMNTPPYAALNPTPQQIQGYTYWRSRIISWFKLGNFVQTLTPLDIPNPQMLVTASSTVQGEISEYTLRYNVLRDIPNGGCIQIIIPSDFQGLNKENICRNAILQSSDFDPYGYQFKCEYVAGPPNYLLIHSFGPFKLDFTDPVNGFQKRNGTTLVVNFRLQNPMMPKPNQWEIKQWYLKEVPLNYLVAKGKTDSPSLQPPVKIEKWEKLLQTRNKLYTEDIGPLEFLITIPANLVAGSLITVQMPPDFTKQKDSQLYCYFDLSIHYNNQLPSKTCKIDINNLVTIQTPDQLYLDPYLATAGGSIPANTKLMIVITTLDNYYGQNGIIMPTNSGFYDFYITYPGSTKATATRTIYVPHKNYFTIFEPTTLINNPNEKTIIELIVQPKVSASTLVLYVPVVDQEGNDLFDEDLGLEKIKGPGINNINCQYHIYPSGVSTSLNCQLIRGIKATKTHAQIQISGISFNSGTTYSIQMDEITNPNVLADDRHVYMILEGYQSATLVSSQINYDFSFKYISTPEVISLNPDPTTVSASQKYPKVIMGGTGAGPNESNIIYEVSWDTKDLMKGGNEYYDYFIIEFPQYAFNKQPITVSCSVSFCKLLRGWNWVIWKFNSNISKGSTVTMKIQGLENVKISSKTVHLIGYTVRNRVLINKQYFQPLDPVTPISPSAGDFIIDIPDYPNKNKVPKNKMMRYLFKIKLPIQLEKDKGLIDIKLPTGFTPEPYCQDHLAYPFVYSNDYISCSLTPAINAYTISGYDTIPTGTIIQVEAWITNPNSQIATPTFNVDIYQDSLRQLVLTSFKANGPQIWDYTPFSTAKYLSEYNTFIRKGSFGDFRFIISGVILTENDYLTLVFPNNDVSASGQNNLQCGFNNFEASMCIVKQASPLTIQIFGPVENPLSPSTSYTVFVTVQNGGQMGLQYTLSGLTYFKVSVSSSTNPTDFTTTFFTIYPQENFPNLAQLEITYENSNKLADLIVNFSTTVNVPANGRIVVSFPIYSEDRSTQIFDMYLGKIGLTPGSKIDCTYTQSISSLNGCTIDSDFYKVSVSFRLTNPLNGQSTLLINDILLPSSSGGTGQIPIELYTQDSMGNILEAVVFDEFLTPFSVPTDPAPQTASLNIIQDQFSIQNINIGFSTNSFNPLNDRIIVKFPIGYDLSIITLKVGTKNYAPSEFVAIGNILIIRLDPSWNSDIINNIVLSNIKSPKTQPATQTIYTYVVIGYVYTSVYTSTIPSFSIKTFTTPSLSLPTHSSNQLPIGIKITATSTETIYGPNTVYFVSLKNSLSVSPIRAGLSLPCESGSEPVYCQLNSSASYGFIDSNPIIYIYQAPDTTSSSPLSITIYNIQEYISKSQITVDFGAIDISSNQVTYRSTLSPVNINTSAKTIKNDSVVLNNTGSIQDQTTITLTQTNPLFVAGTKIVFMSDSLPMNSLPYTPTASIKGSSSSCTVNSNDFVVTCTLASDISIPFDLELKNYPLPTTSILQTQKAFNLIGYESATTKNVFQFSNIQFSNFAASSTLASVSSVQKQDHQIDIQFTTQYIVPALGQVELELASTPIKTGFYYSIPPTTLSLFVNQPTISLVGSKVIIKDFYQMKTGTYKFSIYFEEQPLPQINKINTKCNQQLIESQIVNQSTGSYSPIGDTIIINKLFKADNEVIILDFTTKNVVQSPGYIAIKFDINIQTLTFNSMVVNYQNFQNLPQFTISVDTLYIKNFNTLSAGLAQLRIYFKGGNTPSKIISVISFDKTFNIVDKITSPQTISSNTFCIQNTVSPLRSLNYIDYHTLGGAFQAIKLRIKLQSAFNPTAEQLFITFPQQMQTNLIALMSSQIRFKCNIKKAFQKNQSYRARRCYLQKYSDIFLIIQDFSFNSNDVFDISIIKIGDTKQQWQLPSAAMIYYFQIDKTELKSINQATLPTIYSTDSIQMEVFLQAAKNIYFLNFDGSINASTLYNIKFALSSGYDFIDIEFPLVVDQGASQLTIFNQNLGVSTISNGFSFPCEDKANNLGANVKYRLFYGQAILQNPSKIRILQTSSNSVNINILALLNPSLLNQLIYLRIKTGYVDGRLGNVLYLPYAVFTLVNNPVNSVLPTPIFSPSQASSVISISMNSLSLLKQMTVDSQSSLKFEFEDYQYSPLTNVANTQTDFQTKKSAFFSFKTTASTPYSMVVMQIKTPPIIGSFSYKFKVSEIRNRKVRQVFSLSSSVNLMPGGKFIDNASISALNLKISYPYTLYLIKYDLQQDQFKGNVINVKLPSQYTILSTSTCRLQQYSNKGTVQSTCTADVPNNSLTIQLQQDLISVQTFQMLFYVTNPSSVGMTGQFTIDLYTDATKAQKQHTEMINGVNIVNEAELQVRLLQPFSPIKFCQKDETCPLRFTIQLGSNLVKQSDSLVINTNTYINKMVSLQSNVKELACWINDYASYYCYQDIQTNQIILFAPANTDVSSGVVLHLLIQSWRDPKYSNTQRDFTLLPSYIDFLDNSSIFNGVIIYEQHGASQTPIKKNWQFVNKAFYSDNPAYICSYTTTKGKETILKARFQFPPSIGINSALVTEPNQGRIVIYLETSNEINESLIPYNLESRFVKDGQQIDCICDSCSYANFLCYVQYGGNDVTSPVSITIQPQQNILGWSVFQFYFPKIKLPPVDKRYVRMSIKALQYDSSKKRSITVLEYLNQYIFYTTLPPPSVDPKINLQYPPSHRVGDPLTVTWKYNIPQQQLQKTRDRIIITTTTQDMIIEHPHNPSGPLFTTSSEGKVWIYPLVKWIEIELTTDLSVGTKTVTTFNFKNMPYQITNGVDYELYTYADGETRNIQQYNNIPYAAPHPLYAKAFQFTVLYISQPNTLTFTFRPYNKIPIGGFISIYWGKINPSSPTETDWIFINTYCRIISGLQDASCNIIPQDMRIQIYGFTREYDPNRDGMIKFDLQVQNSGSAGNRQNFQLTIYWDQSGFNNRQQLPSTLPKDRHIIDEDLAYSDLNILYTILLKLNLLERYQEPIPVCGGSRGPIQLKFQFRKDYKYPFDYIRIDFFGQILPLGVGEELICYFIDTTNPKLNYVKTFRCDLNLQGQIDAFVPEETDLKSDRPYILYITARSSLVLNWGVQIDSSSGIKWTRIQTMNEQTGIYNEVAWIEAKIPPCSFDPNNFRVYAMTHEYNTLDYSTLVQAQQNAENYMYNFINVTLSANNPIESGQLSYNKRTRIIFEFMTHNEIFASWDEDVTGNKYTTAQPAGCGGMYNGANYFIPVDSQAVRCTILPAAGQSLSTPSIIIMEDHPNIPASTIFNIGLGRIRNPNQLVDGTVFTQYGSKKYSKNKSYQTSAHIRITIQQKQSDGTFYPINQQWRYYLIPQFLEPIPPASFNTDIFQVYHSSEIVNTGIGNITVNIYPLNMVLSRLRSAVVLQYSYPYELTYSQRCYQHNYMLPQIPHGRVGCMQVQYSRWSVFSNNIFTYTTDQPGSPNPIPAINRFYAVDVSSSRVNPPFTYDYGKSKSRLRGWVYNDKRTVVVRAVGYKNTFATTCNVVLETTAHDNPKNREVIYRVGLYQTTQTDEMRTIRLIAPPEFQDIGHCRVKLGVVLIDFNDIQNKIKCTITKLAQNWIIEISNFKYKASQALGLIILEFLIHNPYDSGWTKQWQCRTFAHNDLEIHDNNQNADGRVWVGQHIPYPNLFRVYRNTISFQERKAGINDYAEFNMRIIPRKSHPQTDDVQSTQIQIWMPLTYDIPNGGINICQVDHIYHQDVDGQYCQITSDRKIFVNTNRFHGLDSTCGLVTFTTINAINDNNGIKMPPSAGNDSFQVFITSKDKDGKVTQEYSNKDATTKPAILSQITDKFQITTQEHEMDQEARIVVQFISPRNIPAGYDTSVGITDPNLKNPIGFIDVQFNTLDYLVSSSYGWIKNLVYATPQTPFACKSYNGVKPKQNEKLICQIIPSESNSPNVFYPATVRISNFQAIAIGTQVEIHLLNIPGPGIINQGLIYVLAFQKNGDGSKFDIIGSSQYILNSSTMFSYDAWKTNMIDVQPNIVGAYSEWVFSFHMLYDLSTSYRGCFDGFYNPLLTFVPGTYFVLKMPKDFQLKDNESISATLGGLPLQIWIYEETNQIFMLNQNTVPCGYYDGTPKLNPLSISQMRNSAYQFLSSYNLIIKTYSPQRKFIREYQFGPINNPNVGQFVLLGMTVSKLFADERYVTYTYSFTPSYDVPANSIITIKLPNRSDLSYPNFGSASPQEVCSVSNSQLLSQSSCQSSFSSSGFSITVLNNISENTNLSIQIIGTRNHPTYSQITQPTDFMITIKNPQGLKINEGYFPQITFLKKRDPSFLYLSMSGTSYFQNVVSDYTFTLQSTSDLPQGGFIIVKFPSNYLEKALQLPQLPKPNQITGSWSSNQFTYSSSWSGPLSNFYTLTITPQFTWLAKNSISIYFKFFSNPLTTIETGLFSAYTVYDSKNVDITDPTDTSLKFSYKPQPDLMQSSFDFNPQNEGSLSTYQMEIKPSKNIPNNSTIQFKFDTNLYPSNLSSASSQVSCSINGIDTICTVQNGVISIPLKQSYSANTNLDIKLNNIMNPPQGKTNIVGQIVTGDSVMQYKSDIGPVESKKTPNNLQIVKLETSSNSLQARAQYTFCIETYDQISLNDAIYIYFPKQFPFKSTYICSITKEHNTQELNYAFTSTSPNCVTQNSQKRISITGQTTAKTSSNLARLCYRIDGVENPSIPGQTDNFVIQIYDQTKSVIKSETSGLTSTQTTLSFFRKGFQIIVGSIPDLPKGVVSNDISIELEISVSYKITAIPFLENFEFIPPVVLFDPTKSQRQYFKIKPLDQAVAGQKLIIWTKQENTTENKFSDIHDSQLNLIDQPYPNSLKAILQTTVSRAALLSTSLPIEIKLNQPASQVLSISVFTEGHQQDSQIDFDPPAIVFQPGEVSQKFRYTTKEKAVSGYLKLKLDNYYKNIYVMPYDTISIEILDVDKAAPQVINYYIESMDRTYMYLRISSDESITVYSMLSLLGTDYPTASELKNSTLREFNQRKTNVMEIYMQNTSFVAPVAKNYIYYDSYLHFTGLQEQTDYVLYFFVEDLSNNQSPVIQFQFTTLKKHNPVSFTLRVNDILVDEKLLNAFGLITSLPPERFQIQLRPTKFKIEGVIEQQILDLIDNVPIEYKFILLQNSTSNEVRPIQKVFMLDNQFNLLQNELSSGSKKQLLDPNFSIIKHTYEMIVIPQEFKFTPTILNVTQDSASFMVSLKYKGIGYAIVQLTSEKPPLSQQIKYGLNSTNYKIQQSYFYTYKFEFKENIPEEQQNITHVFKFTELMDNSQYTAFFVGANSQLVNPDLMDSSKIVKIEFKTKREEISIPKWFRANYIYSQLLAPKQVLAAIIYIIFYLIM